MTPSDTLPTGPLRATEPHREPLEVQYAVRYSILSATEQDVRHTGPLPALGVISARRREWDGHRGRITVSLWPESDRPTDLGSIPRIVALSVLGDPAQHSRILVESCDLVGYLRGGERVL